MLKRESEVVNEELLKDPLCYNLILGGATSEATFNKTYVVDENNNKICVSKDDPNIGIKYFNINKNKVVVKDKSNNNYSVSKDDPRIKTGEFIPINTGFTIVKDKYGNRYRVFKDDPRIKTGELISINKSRIYINNGQINKMVYDYELDEYLNTGWVKGMHRFK